MTISPDLIDSPADIVAALILSYGIGSPSSISSLGAWPIYTTIEPSSPDNVITVFDTTGIQGSRDMFGDIITYFGFQVRIRAQDYRTGFIQAQTIRQNFAKTITETQLTSGSGSPPGLNGSYCVKPIINIGQVISIGNQTPSSKRPIFTLNAMAIVSQL